MNYPVKMKEKIEIRRISSVSQNTSTFTRKWPNSFRVCSVHMLPSRSIKEEVSDDDEEVKEMSNEEEDEELSESETDEEGQDEDYTPDAEDPYSFDATAIVAPVLAEPLASAVAVAIVDRGPAEADVPPKWAGRRYALFPHSDITALNGCTLLLARIIEHICC